MSLEGWPMVCTDVWGCDIRFGTGILSTSEWYRSVGAGGEGGNHFSKCTGVHWVG